MGNTQHHNHAQAVLVAPAAFVVAKAPSCARPTAWHSAAASALHGMTFKKPRSRARSVNVTPSTEPHPAQRASIGNHAHLESGCPERAYSTTGVRTTPAQRAIRTTGLCTTPCTTGAGTTEPAQRAFRKPDSPHPKRNKEWQLRCYGCRTVWCSAAASAPQSVCSKINDLARAAVSWNNGLGGAGGPIPSHCAAPRHARELPRHVSHA
jgi:hypothetical protein